MPHCPLCLPCTVHRTALHHTALPCTALPCPALHSAAGFIQFLEPYYMILVKRRRQVGNICGHAIFKVEESQVVTIPHASVHTSLAQSSMELR